MHYYHQLNHAQRRRFVRRIILLFVAILVVAAIAVAIIFIDNKRSSNANTTTSTTSAVTTSTFESSVQIFRTAYFQFQANSSWSQVLPESSEEKFVYRSKRGAIIDHELVVFVNRDSDHRPITRVLPVTLKRESEFQPGIVSEHCGKKIKAVDQPTLPAVLDQVSFDCTPSEPGYNVLIGQIGGGTKLTLKRADGTLASYIIFYSNVTAAPDGDQLLQIANTFQSR